jgi:hypothetical protein
VGKNSKFNISANVGKTEDPTGKKGTTKGGRISFTKKFNTGGFLHTKASTKKILQRYFIMAHEKNVTKSYIVDGEEIFYNTPDPKLDVPDMSLPSEYGKQYSSLKEAVEGS